MILRIIDKKTGIFLRDDFSCDAETETAIDVEPAQGFYLPKWDGAKWIEGKPPEEIAASEPDANDKNAVVIDMLTKATTVKAVKDAMIEYIAD